MRINKLKEVFKEKKVSNLEISTLVKKTPATITRWKSNKRQPPLTDLYKIAKYLRMDIRDLLHPTTWETDENKGEVAEPKKGKKA